MRLVGPPRVCGELEQIQILTISWVPRKEIIFAPKTVDHSIPGVMRTLTKIKTLIKPTIKSLK